MAWREEEWLALSGIQHYLFCPRQWALIHIEQTWKDNLRTVEGNIFHERCHDGSFMESRGDLLIVRALPVFSASLGVTGVCDVVEFRRAETGAVLSGHDGYYTPLPIEYKRGRPKQGAEDVAQLALQALCLEEMLCCDIPHGCLYYGEMRHREKVGLTEAIRKTVRQTLKEMHKLYERGTTPKAKRTKACGNCSLKELCLPQLSKKQDVSAYYEAALKA